MPPPAAPTPEELRAFRARRNLSQRAMGEVLGVAKRTVEDWESGRNRPPPYLALALDLIDQTTQGET
ncbi:MAG: helix-turn-helix domain-containing protein [Caulobacteraceae bacterium]